MVKFMHRQGLSRPEEHTVGFRRQRGVPEPHQPPDLESLARQHPRHREAPAFGVFQRLPQIEKAAAFGHGRQAVFHRSPEHDPHGPVPAQCLGVQLRIAPGQVQPGDPFRQGGIVQRAEGYKLCPRCLQRFQRLGIDKAKRLILRNGDPDPWFALRRFRFCRSRCIKPLPKPFPVQRLFQRIRQHRDLSLQIADLGRGLQPQMAAFNGRLRQMGQVPHHRQPGLPLQHRSQQIV